MQTELRVPPTVLCCNNRLVPKYNQQDATLYNNLYFTFSVLHVSGGLSAHHQELKEPYVQHQILSSFSAATASVGELFQLTHASVGSRKA